MAAMTLLLAHMHSYDAPDSQNVLAHQYLADRAAIEQVQEHIEEGPSNTSQHFDLGLFLWAWNDQSMSCDLSYRSQSIAFQE